MNVESQHFENETVALDNHRYIRCTFRNCDLIYTGTGPVGLTGNNIHDCRWSFQGPAGQTLEFLRDLYHGGGRAMVEEWMKEIKQPRRR